MLENGGKAGTRAKTRREPAQLRQQRRCTASPRKIALAASQALSVGRYVVMRMGVVSPASSTGQTRSDDMAGGERPPSAALRASSVDNARRTSDAHATLVPSNAERQVVACDAIWSPLSSHLMWRNDGRPFHFVALTWNHFAPLLHTPDPTHRAAAGIMHCLPCPTCDSIITYIPFSILPF